MYSDRFRRCQEESRSVDKERSNMKSFRLTMKIISLIAGIIGGIAWVFWTAAILGGECKIESDFGYWLFLMFGTAYLLLCGFAISDE